MNNPLKDWFIKNNKYVKSPGINPYTHLMLDGGKLNLESDYSTFQEIYSECLNFKNCIVEVKTDIYKFFIDFDFLIAKEMYKEEEFNNDIIMYIKLIQETIKYIYSKDFLCIITSTNVIKEIHKNDKDFLKIGYHLHWPELFVNNKISLNIRENIISRFESLYGKTLKNVGTWDKIFDKSVYNKNGLRMIYSDKYDKSTMTYEGRYYIIKYVFIGASESSELENMYENDIKKSIRDTSIRCEGELPKITDVINIIEYTDEDPPDKIENKGFTSLKKTDQEYIYILKFFNNYVTSHKASDINAILKHRDNDNVYIISSKSKYCNNICGCHTNNHIYFKLTKEGLCQKCRSESEGQSGKKCSSYSSELIPLNQSLCGVLGWKLKDKKVKKETILKEDNSVESIINNQKKLLIGI
tara:strand:+ start:744 stop:1979 length:1236 start_codon:yes stop_codon:yes gene_type:complete